MCRSTDELLRLLIANSQPACSRHRGNASREWRHFELYRFPVPSRCSLTKALLSPDATAADGMRFGAPSRSRQARPVISGNIGSRKQTPPTPDFVSGIGPCAGARANSGSPGFGSRHARIVGRRAQHEDRRLRPLLRAGGRLCGRRRRFGCAGRRPIVLLLAHIDHLAARRDF